MKQYSSGPEQDQVSESNQSSTSGTAAGSYVVSKPTTTGGNKGRRRTIISVLIAFLLLLLILLFFFPRPTATILLTPTSTTLNNSATVSVTTNKLSSTQQGSKTGTPGGPLQHGIHATGSLTFYNYTAQPVTIYAGTFISNASGQQVVTDQTITIPPDPPLIPGVASVNAHAVKVGQSGNIQAMSINTPCCATGIAVLNQAAFSGGLDEQKLHTVQQSDIDSIKNDLKASLLTKAQNDIQSHLQTGEKLVDNTLQCLPEKVTSNPSVGVGATTFSVSVSLTCSALAYNPQTATTETQNQLKQQATQKLDPGFMLVGDIVSKAEPAVVSNNGTVAIAISASGTWKYQFSVARKAEIAQHIARMSVENAKAWLLQQTGIARATIAVSGPIINLSSNNTLPDDLRAITING